MPAQVYAVLNYLAHKKPWDLFPTILTGGGLRASQFLGLWYQRIGTENQDWRPKPHGRDGNIHLIAATQRVLFSGEAVNVEST
jgi:hypothetical protein